MGLLPEEAGGKAVDGWVGEAIRGNDAVPVIVLVDTASSGHVLWPESMKICLVGGCSSSAIWVELELPIDEDGDLSFKVLNPSSSSLHQSHAIQLLISSAEYNS